MNTATDTSQRRSTAGLLDSPILGMAPWIVFSVLVGPGRFEIAVGAALVLTVVLVVVGRVRAPGSSWKILEVCDAVFFAALAVIGALASAGTLTWLETYAGEVSNLALVTIAFGSMAARLPFTLQYARERVPRAHWDSPQFLRTNYLLTGVWGLAFLVAALAGLYGDLVLHNPNNLWTGWIIQIGAIILALRFTEWYPEVVRARIARDAGRPAEVPTTGALLVPLAGYLLPVGIVVLAADAGPAWLGIALIVGGVLLTRSLRAGGART
ncbi:hypothetical protein OH807_39740 [Kitasatospora sp. NBC_01560]|uniref:hypothetical protein n=1 Tax=Kitasatospora sp. NBC_01560 TaxID=2975965 RepID=UPI00386E6115